MQLDGFDWDSGNIEKNWIRHRVSAAECEQIFFNQPLIIIDDDKHSRREKRWHAFGRTDAERFLFIVFGVRGRKLRIISARDMSRKERRLYHEA